MMKEIQTEEDAVGKSFKQILSADYGNQAIIIFDDNTFLGLKVAFGYEPNNAEIICEKVNLLNFNYNELVGYGYLSSQELDELIAEENKAHQRAQEKREKALYEKLKAKFGETND